MVLGTNIFLLILRSRNYMQDFEISLNNPNDAFKII